MLSDKVWNSLTDEQKQICEEAAAEATEYERQFVADLEAKAIEELPSLGVQLVTADQVDGMFLFSCEKSLDSNAFPVDAPVGDRVFFDVRGDFSVRQQIFMGAVEKGKVSKFAKRMPLPRDNAQNRSPVCGNDTR